MAVLISVWTAQPTLAAAAVRAGVDRLGVDLEYHSKLARQQPSSRNWFSDHGIAALTQHAALAPPALFVRTEACTHPRWPELLEAVLARGASVVLLPNVMHVADVEAASSCVAGRALVVPMLESRLGLELLPALAAAGYAEVFFGANDLARDLGLADRFAAMSSRPVLKALRLCQELGLHFGVGGTSRPRQLTPALPVPPEILLDFQCAVGADRVILARSFAAGASTSPGEVDADWVARGVTEIRAAFARQTPSLGPLIERLASTGADPGAN